MFRSMQILFEFGWGCNSEISVFYKYVATYFLLQDLLPIILRNMTDILLSNAKNMYAKDEKSIFQGVYNLLYGTVALIMVSSEDAAVDGDTRLLSPSQVKVRVLKKVSEKKSLITALSEILFKSDSHFSRQETLSRNR